jgi:MATE family multidrug resistance protein
MSAFVESPVERRVQRPTLPLLLSLAWPIVLSRMSQTVIGLSDAVLVAHLGAAALAATATGAMNTFTVLILPMGLMFMVSSFASQLHGRGDEAGARRYAWYGLLVAALTQLACLVMVPLLPKALALLPYEPDVLTLMSQYVVIRLMSGGAAIGIEALANYYGGLGRTRPGMIANVVAMVVNVALNWVLIQGHFGAPALGVAGSALASALATWLGFLGFFVFFWREAPLLRLRLKAAEFWRLMRFGLPSGLNWFFEFLAFIFFVNVVVAGLGTAALAATNAVFNINSVAFMPALGIASAGAILVGQAIGAGHKEDVPRAVRLTLLAALVWQGCAGLISLLFAHALMAPFAKGEGAAEVEALGAQMLMLSAGWQLFDATANSLAEALRAAGDTLFPLVGRLLIAWVIFVPGAYISVHSYGWKTPGATLWMIIYLACLALLLALRYRSGVWRKVHLV